MSVILEAGRVMNRLFERRAESACSAVPFFKFNKVAWGSGYVREIDGALTVDSNLPSDIFEITGEFARTNAIFTYDPVLKRINIEASIAQGQLNEGVNALFTALYVLDDAEGVVAIAVCMPVYVTKERGLSVKFTLEVVEQN